MKRSYHIEVECANCANKMEAALQRIEGIEHAAIQFMTQKLTVEFSAAADPDAVMQKAQKVCRTIEPDCEIIF
ncbi:MAG: heavy-metal-associated domain-containing protein [Oscillospiraceae bacterium]|nr:heavy-metal-associated domain-containing protein [Oscillospiraceae bacterium]